MRRHATCVAWTAFGVLAGCSLSAYAQDAQPAPDLAPVAAGVLGLPLWVVQLFQFGVLPGVLGLLGWIAGRGNITIRVSLSDEDRKLLAARLAPPPKGR